MMQQADRVGWPCRWMLPGMYSYAPDVPTPSFDPDGAIRLLADAGYKDGFRLTLHGSNDRFPNDGATAQALAQMWTCVGVRTSVETMPFAAFANGSSAGNFPWCSPAPACRPPRPHRYTARADELTLAMRLCQA